MPRAPRGIGRRSASSEGWGGTVASIACMAGTVGVAGGHPADKRGRGPTWFGSGNVVGMKVTTLDHLVLTVQDLDSTVDFYTRVLGMTVSAFGEGRLALKYGTQKINL